MSVFNPVNPKQNFSELEDSITKFWKQEKIFEKSIEQRPIDDKYVFYDGPPFITGTPHYGSLLPSIAKDVVPRYWTMRGKRVDRKWGWDCHGLPIENKVEAKVGLKNRRDIEKFGIGKFVEECYNYTRETSAEWQWYVDKIGRWVDFENSYKTMDKSYMESVIWVFKQLWDKDLVYEGTRVSLFCTRCGTPISNFEIAMDNSYADMEDPAVTIKFEINTEKSPADLLKNNPELEDASILAWTTTPWTLPSNRALVVDPKEVYSIVEMNRKIDERKGFGVIIVDKETNKVLVLRDKQKINTFVAGALEGSETEEEGVKREVLEETGYRNLNIVKKLGNLKFYSPKRDFNFHFKDYNFYLAELSSKEKVKPTKPDTESQEIVWLNLDNIEKNVTFEGSKKFAELVKKYYKDGKIDEINIVEDSVLNEAKPGTSFKDRVILAKKRIGAVFGESSEKEISENFKDHNFEIEMAWLVKELPENLTQYKKAEISQAYLSTRDTDGIERRIRQTDNNFEYTTKEYAGSKKETGQLKEETKKITQTEYLELEKKAKLKIKKIRYYIPIQGGLTAELNIYTDKYEGLSCVEVEFNDKNTYEHFQKPSWFGKEVTDSLGIYPPYLAKHTKEEIQKELEEYVQPPHKWTIKENSNSAELPANMKVIKEIKGSDLVGLSYTPLFDYFPPNDKDLKVYEYKGMVTMDEGTGIVHSAPGFGDIDTEMGWDKGLTIMNSVNDEGKFRPEVKDYAGIYIKDADPIIIKDLIMRNQLLKAERITHRYPFCYRCSTPLIHKAQPSWFIKIDKLRKRMLETNGSINWVPDHLKTGRFKKGIEQAPDWCISRSRYWATPMPVWKCQGSYDESARVVMVHGNGSTDPEDLKTNRSWQPHLLNEFKKVGIEAHGPHMPEPEFAPSDKWLPFLENEMKVDENTILIGSSSGAVAAMRYAETHKVKGLILVAACYTDLGDETEKKSGYFDKEWDWDAIKQNTEWIIQYHSQDDPFIPFKEAQFIHEKLDTDFRTYEHEGHFSKSHDQRFEFPELVKDVKDKLRTGGCEAMEVFGSIKEIEERSGQKIEDLHRPFIDNVTFKCKKCGGIMERIPEVLDVWLDSGSMPYGQKHYPFENKADFDRNFPADFIIEYIGQTRAWFYVMHVIGNALFDSESYKNVITTGVIFGTDGRKMSKSYGNYPDPKEVLQKYGAEALRMYMMSSPIMVGEDMNLDEQGIKDQIKAFILPLWNSYSFFVTYANMHNWTPDQTLTKEEITGHGEKIDLWILAKLQKTIRNIRIAMDEYDIPRAAREYPEFIQDLSKWYIRQNRSRFSQGDKTALGTLYYVLLEYIKLLAPFAPFITDAIWQNLAAGKTGPESVHLADFPDDDPKLLENSKDLIYKMDAVREIVNLGQSIRVEEGLKVRQPLSEIEVNMNVDEDSDMDIEEWMKSLISQELNVKTVDEDNHPSQEPGWVYKESANGKLQLSINTELTDELKREGLFREFTRTIQSLRKKQKMNLDDKLAMKVVTEAEDMLIMLDMFKEEIKTITNTDSMEVKKSNLKESNIIIINGLQVEIIIENA